MIPLNAQLSLPLQNPVLIFSLVLLIILIAPIIFNRLRIPSVIGLIIAGVIVGPFGLNLLLRDSSIELFGTVGLLYIMFLAGLEIELMEFRRNIHRSITFGALTFFIPMTLGILTGIFILGYPLLTVVLLASMYASHTLLAYPIASRLGVSKIPVVNVSVGGTMITDTAALLVLAVIASSVRGEINQEFWIRMGVSSVFVFVVVLWGIPMLTRWFFKNIEDGISQFIFVLGMIFLASSLAVFASLEAIIGAFLAGIALNRLITATSPLMTKIEFVGNALFIPFFLIGVGMLVDYRVMFSEPRALLVAGVMTVTATCSKWLAAFVTQKIYGYTKHERLMMFGLSNAQAAATLAAVLVGYKLEIFNEEVLNGSIMMIMVTCIISSFAVEKAGKAIAIGSTQVSTPAHVQQQRILIPIANPASIEQLVNLALAIKKPKRDKILYPLAVVKDDQETHLGVRASQQMLEQAVKYAAAAEHTSQVLTRVDVNIANGIIRAAKEILATDIVIGWNAKRSAKDFVFGSVLDKLTMGSHQQLLVNRFTQPINTIGRTLVVAPNNAEFEVGFSKWVDTILNMTQTIGSKLLIYCSQGTASKVTQICKEGKKSVSPNFYPLVSDLNSLLNIVKTDDLLVIVSARRGGISYQRYLDRFPLTLSKFYAESSFIVLFPERQTIPESEGKFQFDSSMENPLTTLNQMRLKK